MTETLHAVAKSGCRPSGSGRTSTPAPTARRRASACSARSSGRRTSISSRTWCRRTSCACCTRAVHHRQLQRRHPGVLVPRRSRREHRHAAGRPRARAQRARRGLRPRGDRGRDPAPSGQRPVARIRSTATARPASGLPRCWPSSRGDREAADVLSEQEIKGRGYVFDEHTLLAQPFQGKRKGRTTNDGSGGARAGDGRTLRRPVGTLQHEALRGIGRAVLPPPRFAGVPRERFRGRGCLDAGCGGGRNSIAMARLGAARVTGIDLGVQGLEDARAARRILQRRIQHVSILDIPFPDATFDVVWCAGVPTIRPMKSGRSTSYASGEARGQPLSAGLRDRRAAVAAHRVAPALCGADYPAGHRARARGRRAPRQQAPDVPRRFVLPEARLLRLAPSPAHAREARVLED